MTQNDISKILEAINELRVDIAVLQEGKSADADVKKDIVRLKIAVACLFVAFVASGISAAGIPLPLG